MLIKSQLTYFLVLKAFLGHHSNSVVTFTWKTEEAGDFEMKKQLKKTEDPT